MDLLIAILVVFLGIAAIHALGLSLWNIIWFIVLVAIIVWLLRRNHSRL